MRDYLDKWRCHSLVSPWFTAQSKEPGSWAMEEAGGCRRCHRFQGLGSSCRWILGGATIRSLGAGQPRSRSVEGAVKRRQYRHGGMSGTAERLLMLGENGDVGGAVPGSTIFAGRVRFCQESIMPGRVLADPRDSFALARAARARAISAGPNNDASGMDSKLRRTTIQGPQSQTNCTNQPSCSLNAYPHVSPRTASVQGRSSLGFFYIAVC